MRANVIGSLAVALAVILAGLALALQVGAPPSGFSPSPAASAASCALNLTAMRNLDLGVVELGWEPGPRNARWRVERAEAEGPLVPIASAVVDSKFLDEEAARDLSYRYVVVQQDARSSRGCASVAVSALA